MFKSFASLLIASLSMVALAAADGDYIKCQTSGGSPWAYDCANALNALDKSKCYGLNAQSSGCKNIISKESCTVTVCVDDKFFFNGFEVAGQFIYDTGYKLLDGCGCSSDNCKVGGYFHVADPDREGGDSHGCITTGISYANVEFTKH
ncbi:hypothetical protein BC941DRAFT_421473 [Chlamydoabsidia padenii]|nr:hypothetical protein BC941DRAFT_421473 [Chlamydoabsidia padenii]